MVIFDLGTSSEVALVKVWAQLWEPCAPHTKANILRHLHVPMDSL